MSDKEVKEFLSVLANEFRNIRRQHNLTLEDVAKDLNVSPSYVGKLEKGQLVKLSIFTYAKLAMYYKVNLSDVVKNSEEIYELNKKYFK